VAALDRVEVDLALLKPPDLPAWWLEVPAIGWLHKHGLDLDPRVTVVVGENGSGKSTFVEAVAHRWAAGLTAAVKHWAPEPASEDSSLRRALVLRGERPRPQGGCFLRAEAMHTLFADVDAGRGPHAGASRAFGGRLNTRSHGESFLGFLESRVDERGLFILDEPEAALSFQSCLRLMALLGAMVEGGSQVLLATHSPLLAAFPGATVLEFSERGITRTSWDDLELVQHWRTFMDAPDAYLRYLFD
jgi:predicted ATPase